MSSVSGHSRRGLLAASAAVMAAAPAVKTQAGEKKGKGKPKPPLVVITVVIRDLMQIENDPEAGTVFVYYVAYAYVHLASNTRGTFQGEVKLPASTSGSPSGVANAVKAFARKRVGDSLALNDYPVPADRFAVELI